MTVIRQDAWTDDHDQMLAEITLRSIRDGSTQLQAFEEVGQKLGRTPAACGFRWNSFLRKKYIFEIKSAKELRNLRKGKNLESVDSQNMGSEGVEHQMQGIQQRQLSIAAVKHSFDSEEHLTFENVIRFLKNQKRILKEVRLSEKTLDEYTEEIERLRKENQELQRELENMQNEYDMVKNDYQALIQIMDRARKMAFLLEEQDEHKKVFNMESNGNLVKAE